MSRKLSVHRRKFHVPLEVNQVVQVKHSLAHETHGNGYRGRAKMNIAIPRRSMVIS